MMSNKHFLALPVTGDTFAEVREKNCYYVDKTPYLKQVFFNNGATVLLFVRPNKFGKTMLLTMFESFFNINYQNPGDITYQQKLFYGTKIYKDQEFCNEFMGQNPVIYLSFKDFTGKDIDEAYSKLAQIISAKVNEYSFLKDCPQLNDNDKNTFSIISDEAYLKNKKAINRSFLTSAIGSLVSMLYAYFKRQVYVFIDDYDIPLVCAFKHGYYDDMVMLYSHLCYFFKDFKKAPETDLSIISNIVATSSSPIVQNCIPTVANNIKTDTSLDYSYRYADIFGFTEDETDDLLKDYELESYSQTVKEYYGGYNFSYSSDIFNPLDLIKFVEANCKRNLNSSNETVETDGYWTRATFNSVLSEYIACLTDHDNQNMQDLVDGKSICFELNEFTGCCKLSEPVLDDMWSLLLNFGYLIKDLEKTKDENKKHRFNGNVFARIPNLEIKKCFENYIQKRFKTEIAPNSVADALANNLFEGKAEIASDTIYDLLQSYISIKDNATKAPHENYHGYLNVLFSNCSENFFSEYHSNYESGDGYAYIIFKSKREDKVVIIEIKSAPVGTDLNSLAKSAIAQIEEKNYAEPFLQSSMTKSIYAYGIVFSGKNCTLSVKKIK